MFDTFISGAILMELWAIGLFFIRFWRKTRDPLLLWFGLAFWILAVERLVPLCVAVAQENSFYIYSFRLVAFSLISTAILRKNSPSKASRYPRRSAKRASDRADIVMGS
jgi:hypothetical protein